MSTHSTCYPDVSSLYNQNTVEYLRMMILQSNVLLASISGGTDIIACFMGENSVLPVYRGEIQSPHLGCDIQVEELGTSRFLL